MNIFNWRNESDSVENWSSWQLRERRRHVFNAFSLKMAVAVDLARRQIQIQHFVTGDCKTIDFGGDTYGDDLRDALAAVADAGESAFVMSLLLRANGLDDLADAVSNGNVDDIKRNQ